MVLNQIDGRDVVEVECSEGDGSSLPSRSACHNEVRASGEVCVCARRAASEVQQGERGRRHLRAVHRH